MLRIIEKLAAPQAAQGSLTLPFEGRRKSRQRVRLDSGEEAALLLPPGTVLRQGDCLLTETGQVLQVRAAPESVSTARADDALLLARAAYHLGNRHIALQVGPGWVRYLHDHVLDDLARELGLSVAQEQAPFEPEVGAYGHGGLQAHSHGEEHRHGHGHDREHDHQH